LAINAIKKDFHVFLESLRHRKYALTYLIALTFVSTVLFSFIEHHTLFDSFYWTITVFTTVGFGDITPHTIVGKLLFLLDAISGITTYIYLITSWQTSVVEARLERKLWELADADFKQRTRKTKSQLFSDQPKINNPNDQPQT
jgi:voltage-gated potassium channel